MSYFTLQPEKEQLPKYLEDFKNNILKKKNTEFWILGRMIEHIDNEKLPESIRTFKSIKDLVEEI